MNGFWWITVAGGLFFVSRARQPTFETKNALFSTEFDPLFSAHCPGIPVPYLRSLAKHESDFNASDSAGCCIGLLQISDQVRQGFNAAQGTDISRSDLLRADVSVLIGCDLIARIARALPTNHPQILPPGPGGMIDFRNPRHVEVLTQAWNAGFSEASGVGRVLSELEDRSTPQADLSVFLIGKVASEIGASRFLSMPSRHDFARRVTRDFFAQL